MGGYLFAHTYIEYLHKTFGWENVLTLARTSDYEKACDVDEATVYDGWIRFLQENYS